VRYRADWRRCLDGGWKEPGVSAAPADDPVVALPTGELLACSCRMLDKIERRIELVKLLSFGDSCGAE
jgi:hypothetical protein